MRVRAAAGVWLLLIASAPAARAQTPAGGPFQVNTYTTEAQNRDSIAIDRSGEMVVTWTSDWQDGDRTGVFAQRLSPSGAPRGSEFQVNSYTTADQSDSKVAIDAKGRFVVVWTSPYTWLGPREVFGQRFDAAGARLGGEFRVNSFTTSDQYSPAVAMAPTGAFTVVWSSFSQDGDQLGVFGQRFDASGARLGGEFQVNTYTTGFQGFPKIARDADGRFMVIWESDYQDGSDRGVFGRTFSAAGAALGAEVQINTYTTNTQVYASVAAVSGGDFVVVWSSVGGQDGDASGIFGQRIDALGHRRGSEFQVNSYTTYEQMTFGDAIASDESGNFVVAWSSFNQFGPLQSDVVARRFDASGAPRGGEFQVSTSPYDHDRLTSAASDPAGNFVVTWSQYVGSFDRVNVFAGRFGGLFPAALAVDAAASPTSDGNGVLEGGETVAIAPSWRNVNGTAQTFAGAASAFGGPVGPVYTLTDASSDYGSVPDGTTRSCATVGNCYAALVAAPSGRPLQHWDAVLREDILPDVQGQSMPWLLHVGESFTDVPRGSSFYRFVETLLHRGVTAGCSSTVYCPASATTREEMAVFVLTAKEGAGYLPPACATPLFADVPASSPYCRFIEELARRGVVGGCGGGLYCPGTAVAREQMAVFVLRTLEPGSTPPPCIAGSEAFADVPASSPFCRWIEELARRAVVTGCGGGNYCPAAAVTREQMSVFLTVTFGLTLYGP